MDRLNFSALTLLELHHEFIEVLIRFPTFYTSGVANNLGGSHMMTAARLFNFRVGPKLYGSEFQAGLQSAHMNML